MFEHLGTVTVLMTLYFQALGCTNTPESVTSCSVNHPQTKLGQKNPKLAARVRHTYQTKSLQYGPILRWWHFILFCRRMCSFWSFFSSFFKISQHTGHHSRSFMAPVHHILICIDFIGEIWSNIVRGCSNCNFVEWVTGVIQLMYRMLQFAG